MEQHLLTADCRYACIRKADLQDDFFFFKKKISKHQRYSCKINPSKLRKQLGQETIESGAWHPSRHPCWPEVMARSYAQV